MTDPVPLASFISLRLVAGAETPPEHAQYDGQVLLLPPEYLSSLGMGPTDPGVVVGLRGYYATGGPTGHQWVITGPVTAQMRQAIDTIPGADGWRVPASRTAFRGVARELFQDHAMPGPDVVTALRRLFSAAVAERDANTR